MGFAIACTSVTSLCLIMRHMPESLALANGILESAIGVRLSRLGLRLYPTSYVLRPTPCTLHPTP